MKAAEQTVDNTNRLAMLLIEQRGIDYDEAITILKSLQLNLECGEEIRNSVPLQAALLTAVNTGVRAFLGGVNIAMPPDVQMLLPWHSDQSLLETVGELGATISDRLANDSITLLFGLQGNIDENKVQVICNDWQGGINPTAEPIDLPVPKSSLPLGGIAAGSIAVSLAFIQSVGLKIGCMDRPAGISLWRPDLDWLSSDATGEKLEAIPSKLWLLGLGHLGQGYLWSIGLLPKPFDEKIKIFLQDYDKMVEANYGAGLLCKKDSCNYKTRICAKWLEQRGFETAIIEKAFDTGIRPNSLCDEPTIALCGFDTAKARRLLDTDAFDLIIESGLGGALDSFDEIIIHTFPGKKSPKEIWKEENEGETLAKVLEVMNQKEGPGCGMLAVNLSSKSISSSFVGAFAGALVVSELIRAAAGATKFDKISIQLRTIKFRKAFPEGFYSDQIARNGLYYC